MKRFHVHVAVKDLDASIRFYSTLFGLPPTLHKPNYAKWQLDDPRVNFAISNGRNMAGVNHLGIQTDSEEELEALHGALAQADVAAAAEHDVACCYHRSNKYWVTDPTGIAWETFHTMGEVPTFGESPAMQSGQACCSTNEREPATTEPKQRAAVCCG